MGLLHGMCEMEEDFAFFGKWRRALRCQLVENAFLLKFEDKFENLNLNLT